LVSLITKTKLGLSVLDVATTALASGEEDKVVAALDLQPAIAGRRTVGGDGGS